MKGDKREGDNSQEKREGKRDVIGGVVIFGNLIPNWTSLTIEKREKGGKGREKGREMLCG